MHNHANKHDLKSMNTIKKSLSKNYGKENPSSTFLENKSHSFLMFNYRSETYH
jgi:hypothetical protein